MMTAIVILWMGFMGGAGGAPAIIRAVPPRRKRPQTRAVGRK
jgi:hypothetical protein